jgi:hypothetical protein
MIYLILFNFCVLGYLTVLLSWWIILLDHKSNRQLRMMQIVNMEASGLQRRAATIWTSCRFHWKLEGWYQPWYISPRSIWHAEQVIILSSHELELARDVVHDDDFLCAWNSFGCRYIYLCSPNWRNMALLTHNECMLQMGMGENSEIWARYY